MTPHLTAYAFGYIWHTGNHPANANLSDKEHVHKRDLDWVPLVEYVGVRSPSKCLRETELIVQFGEPC